MAIVSLLAAGIVHLLIAPDHMDHAPAHGLFFGFAGLMQIGWAFEFRRAPTRRIVQAGMALSGGMILLWALTQVAGAPFSPAPEPIDWSAVVSKLAEGFGMAALAVMAWRGQYAGGSSGGSSRRALAEGVGLALAACLVSYGGARATEPLLPQLAGPGHSHASHDGPDNAVLSNSMLITSAWVRPPALIGGNGAAYLSITNFTGKDDTLLSVTTSVAARTQLDRSTAAARDVSQTALIDSLPVPQGGPLILEPGGAEILLIGVTQDLADGQIVPISLHFKGAGQVDVRAEVVANFLPLTATP